MPILETVIAKVLGDTAMGALKTGWRKIRPFRRGLPMGTGDGPVTAYSGIEDLVTGSGQALIACRKAVEHFERYGVVVDPVSWSLNEDSAAILYEARRTVEEAEARLPRVQSRVGTGAAVSKESDAAITALRAVVKHLRSYVEQRNEDWDFSPLNEAKAALSDAEQHQKKALDAASKLAAR